ncbi:MAG TPA: isoleucine--tRNA ligase [Bacteroidales bacterium]|nr:isoleucine--tRNA ligase [Bacteroidales bacterium]
MDSKYTEYNSLKLTQIEKEIRSYWEKNDIFHKSMRNREGNESFVFYEGPPSANGKPGIHHVISRTIKDIFCRYKTLKGFHVARKAGWDTHGLPIEIAVEKTLGITKDYIGKKISVEEYNQSCRTEVMKYKDLWDELTLQMGYWVDLNDPYITFDNKYIESVWYLLSKLYEKGLLYKGYTIQPYSPAAGSGLSTHELNQPGCYRDVKDTSVTALFTVIRDEKSAFLFENNINQVWIMAWTTTPWTLPSNTALAVGANISYLKVKTFNPYTGLPVTVVLAKDLLSSYFNEKAKDAKPEDYKPGDKLIPYEIIDEFKGSRLEGIRYEQLIPWIKPDGDAFRVITGDFVTTADGTGVVHIAPTFGADDARVAKITGIAPLTLIDKNGSLRPMVDLHGRFFPIEELDEDFVKKFVNIEKYSEFAGRYVKNDYDTQAGPETPVLDIDLSVMLKIENKAFKIEKYVHSYPHCWRTDKPVLYYPMDSWFIKTTAFKERMIELNNTINWKPKSTGIGRFGNWLENLVDWNLSRSRFWGVGLPIWTSDDKKEQKCIGSVAQLKSEIEKSIAAGFMQSNPFADFEPGNNSTGNYKTFDLHRPYIDEIILVSENGQKLYREPDLIDVWFDSGAMPYAQFHYPFEKGDHLSDYFPADFIAEGVDQTRGWFFTLHAIATMVFDSVAYKTCVSNGLVLDKNGNKMSKRLGNAVDPFETIEQYGADATRWYMITNAQPWDNLKFDTDGIVEVQRKFFGTLYNTYAFFALYANIDGFKYDQEEIPIQERPELDRWILSELNTLIKLVDEAFDDYEPTKAGRAIAQFVDYKLSNWYVRLSRRRFWKGEFSTDKISAYQTLYRCLESLAVMISPIAPFFADRLFLDLNNVTGRQQAESVHLTDMVQADESFINKDLEEKMELAQQITSMVLSLRKSTKIKVRQPLNKMMIPVLSQHFKKQVQAVEKLVLAEVNVKELEFMSEDSAMLVKKLKANFKTLGPRYGKQMKKLAPMLAAFTNAQIAELEKNGNYHLDIDGEPIEILLSDVEIITQDIPGWLVATEGNLTVALDITITPELREEGLARDLVNRIQNLRKDKNFEVTDKIYLKIKKNDQLNDAIKKNFNYICSETLALSLDLVDEINHNAGDEVEVGDDIKTNILVEKAV